MIREELDRVIRNVKDFPKPGINFKDITPVLLDPTLCKKVIDAFVEGTQDWGQMDAIAGVESRGFLFGMQLADRLSLPFIPIRKQGKLPYKKVSHSYELEYGSAVVEMHEDAIKPNWNVMVHDDLLATGGTALAAASLIESQGGCVAGFSFLVGLDFLGGDQKLKTHSDNIVSLINY